MSPRPHLKDGQRKRYRTRYRAGIMRIGEVYLKANGWWVIGHDRKANMSVSVRPGQVFSL